MRSRLLHIILLASAVMLAPLFQGAHALTAPDAVHWTAGKIEKASKRAARAANKKKWSLAIRYGEQALQGLRAHGMEGTMRYLETLVQVNGYYIEAGRLPEVEARIGHAYVKARASLGVAHDVTRAARAARYRQLVEHENYTAATELVREALSVLGTTVDDAYRRHRYLKHLYSLYGLAGEHQLEEEAIKEFLTLDTRLYGNTADDHARVIQNLAKSYCQQGKRMEFEALQVQQQSKFICPPLD